MFAKLSARVCVPFLQVSARRLSTSGDISYSVHEAEDQKDSIPVVLAHGALGNKKNFNTLAKRLSTELSCPVISYDARNHGKSKHTDDMSLESMSDDFEHLLEELGVEKCILIGHSLGGRTSMYTALHKPHLIEDLVVVDVPVMFDMGRKCSLIRYLEAMRKVNWENSGGSIAKARLTADRQLKPHIRDEVVRQFVLTNIELSEETGEIMWRCNLNPLLELLKSDSSVLTDKAIVPYPERCLFLCGGNSNYVKDNDVFTIKEIFPNSTVSHIPDCGHWVHFEKPNEFLQSVKGYLQPQE